MDLDPQQRCGRKQWCNYVFKPGENWTESGPLVTVGDPLAKTPKKSEEMIVKLWMSWRDYQNRKSPENTPKMQKIKNILKTNKNTKTEI